MKTNRGFKVTDKDMKCRDFQFELGKEFKHEGEIELCESGFHFCKKLVKCFDYYDFNPKNRVFEIEHEKAIGDIDNKMVTNSITLLRELSWGEVLEKVNTGIGNSGYRNSGDWNSGHRNSGDWNSGDWNSGSMNSGDWNSGDMNSGYLNTNIPKLRIFNKETDVDIFNIYFPAWMYFEVTQWVYFEDMTDEEKINYEDAEVTGGYLKTLDYKEAAQLSYDKATKEDQDAVELLPNYDADILFEIFGIDRRN